MQESEFWMGRELGQKMSLVTSKVSLMAPVSEAEITELLVEEWEISMEKELGEVKVDLLVRLKGERWES